MTVPLAYAQRIAANHLARGWPYEEMVVDAALALRDHPAWDVFPGIGGGVSSWERRWGLREELPLSVPRIDAVYTLIRALRGEVLPDRRGRTERPVMTRREAMREMRYVPAVALARTIMRARRDYGPRAEYLGWRGWNVTEDGSLLSPFQKTKWHSAECRVEQWDSSATMRGVAGIHALWVPPQWRAARAHHEMGGSVHGIVERFGRAVLGTEGWRAEWVVVREILAPDDAIAAAIRRQYPDVIVTSREGVQ
ncbi:MAG: hypothetical protein IT537_03330 [Hyphomicrobiales bacterium]|nr:hypothetical protein [Hyphomicrobiales bacterium]